MKRTTIVLVVGVALLVLAGCKEEGGRPGGVETECANGEDDDRDGQTDCADSDCAGATECLSGFGVTLYSEDLQSRGLDLLVVMDNSAGTSNGQENVRMGINSLLYTLRQREGGLPDLHIGVVTTDLGAGGQPITYCEDAGGDEGRLVTGNCTYPTAEPYIVDVQPRGCTVEWALDGSCATHDCTGMHCAHESMTEIFEDGDGCPRCRNIGDQELMDAFNCTSNVGYMGCGFEQPLEAMYLALNNNPYNAGFLREDAHLAVVIFADEDDCSVADDHFFDMSDTAIDSELGPLSSFRCFEFGVKCDVEDRETTGLWPNCAPREADDPKALLHTIDRYTQLLRSLKWEDDFTVAVMAAPVEEDGVRVGTDELGNPQLVDTCGNPEGGTPGVRLKAFVEALHTSADVGWAFAPCCGFTVYLEEMTAMGERIVDALGDACAPAPPLGCTDVAVEFGLPGDGQACNDVCVPSCLVEEVILRGTLDEEQYTVPPCLEVCTDGPCPGNTDRQLAYASAHPLELDPDLPVPVCWHFGYDAACEDGRGARLTLSRQIELPPRSWTTALCNAVTPVEYHCTDGDDNDGDCLTDAEDPDCQ